MYFRNIRYVSAMRAAAAVFIEDGEPQFRAKRNKRHLPNAWDDYPIQALRIRNWKRFRKTQFKSVNA